MSSRSMGPARGPVAVALCLMLAAMAVAALAAADAHAAYYKMVACSGSNGAPPYSYDTNTRSSTNPEGIFHAWNFCTGQGGDPPGNSSYIRIQEHKWGGEAGHTAYGRFVFDTPGGIHFKAAGGYTRQNQNFNSGWRSRFWVASSCCTAQIVSQGKGVSGGGTTSTFAPHLWPLNVYYDFTRFVFEMNCVNSGGCSTNGTNSTDVNGFVFILSDDHSPRVEWENTGRDLLAGRWVRGTQKADFESDDDQSGMRAERVLLDGHEHWRHDHGCSTSSSSRNGEWARTYKPCPNNERDRHVSVDTAKLSDGAHKVKVCVQDFSQYQSGGETCDSSRTIRTDSTAPAAPAGLEVTSANPERYLPRFGAKWTLPADPGSPIAKVHYDVIDADEKVVVPERTISATNPTSLPEIEGPERRGAYWVRVWLEDEVGHVGPAAGAPVPRDTTPPAAPQDLRIAASSTERWVDRFGLRWRNIADDGSPIVAAYYQVRDRSGKVVARTRTVNDGNVQEIRDIRSPSSRGHYTARVWLRDAEGNVGAPARVPLPLDTEPPAAPQGVSVAPPDASRAAAGFDVRWRNISDDGSPIDAAHYKVLSAAGEVVVPPTTVPGRDIEAIAGLNAPGNRGTYTLRLWLTDEEGNVGAPASVPLSYSCVRSEAGPGMALTSAIARKGRKRVLVRQGRGAALRGRLFGAGGTGVPGASLCVFGRVVTDAGPEFLGVALTGAEGRYRFPVPAGPTRELTVVHRFGHRRIAAGARIATKVRPTFKVRRKVVRNKGFARFHGRIPGPHNDRVVVVLQVKRGKGWLAFRRYRTRRGGRFTVGYRFSRTTEPTLYVMRAQVRAQGGYPYVQGTSRPLRLIVLPARRRGH
jgi:hypothetical protein